MSVRKASVLELATAAYDLDASVTRGHSIEASFALNPFTVLAGLVAKLFS